MIKLSHIWSLSVHRAHAFAEMQSPTLVTTTYMVNMNQNLKYILQSHLFDWILKSDVDANEFWDKIDQPKLKEGISEFHKTLHSLSYESQQKNNNSLIIFSAWDSSEVPTIFITLPCRELLGLLN